MKLRRKSKRDCGCPHTTTRDPYRRCTRGLEVQTLVLPKALFSRASALSWARSQSFRTAKIDETGKSYRLRQRDPGDFVRGSFRTIPMGDRGAKAVVGCPLPGRESDKGKRDSSAIRKGDRFDHFGETLVVVAVSGKGREITMAKEVRDSFGKTSLINHRTWHPRDLEHMRKLPSQPRRDEAWRTATKEGAPYLLWSNAVTLAAIRKGAPPEMMREPRIRKILHRAYDAGEPVWMAADEVAFVAKEVHRLRGATQARRAIVRRSRRAPVR